MVSLSLSCSTFFHFSSFPPVLLCCPLFGRFSFCLLSLDMVVWPRSGDQLVSQNPREFYEPDLLGWILGCAGNIWSEKNKPFCTIPCGSTSIRSCFMSYTHFTLIYCIRFLCDSSLHLYHHITYFCYFDASCLFLLWHS